ncbi:MAG TPA: hypothetical protein PL067_09455 [Bacteroidales bacterium]|nr:hypothetical protein [Candidatus Fermentibacter daniensis]HPO40937.1 hypothetical protein [Bacteroidales bacterium]
MTIRKRFLATFSALILLGICACGPDPAWKTAKEYLEARYPGIELERSSLKTVGHGAYESVEGVDYVEFYGVLENGESISGQVNFSNGQPIGVETE